MVRIHHFLVAFMVLGATSAAWAQQPSLGEVARKEAQRRKTTKGTRVYTNADVKGRGILTTAAVEATPPPAEQPPAATAVPPEEVRDEAWWRKRKTHLTNALARNQLFAEALQSRINALWADFTARDDPAQREVVAANREEALAELDRVKTEIAQQERALADLEDEARRASVPPGWLR